MYLGVAVLVAASIWNILPNTQRALNVTKEEKQWSKI